MQLNSRLCDWPLIDVDKCLARYKSILQRELRDHGIRFDFHLWVSDEWFCPDGVPGFALPFYLFNPQLMKIHKAQTGVIEGRTDREILMLMRHELGHAIDNAYGLRKNKNRIQAFGNSGEDYPDSYSPKVFSKNYVKYLGDGYAQSHPDEDFAETFAYWLDPSKKWHLRAFSRKLTDKLNCMDRLMREIRGHQPLLKNRYRIDPIEKNESTLARFYQEYHEQRNSAGLNRVDQQLKQAFRWPKEKTQEKRLAFYLRKQKANLKRTISLEQGVHQYEAERALRKIIERAEVLDLRCSVHEFRNKTPQILSKNFQILKEQELLSVYL